MQLALRGLQAMLASPRVWAGFAAIIAILVVTGPFGTLDAMEFSRRLVYWAGISMVTFPLGYGLTFFLSVVLERRGLAVPPARLLAGAVAGIPVGMAVWGWNLIDALAAAGSSGSLATYLSYTVPITACVSAIFHLVDPDKAGPDALEPASPEEAAVQADPPFFRRLHSGLGRDLISLQAQDHYVRAVTARGAQMVLMRLADAETELEGIPGLRVHRSWWVAGKHLERLEAKDGKQMAILSNGERIPVSRTFLPDVRRFLGRRASLGPTTRDAGKA